MEILQKKGKTKKTSSQIDQMALTKEKEVRRAAMKLFVNIVHTFMFDWDKRHWLKLNDFRKL